MLKFKSIAERPVTIIFVLFFLLVNAELHAQNQTSSPYSRFGIGDLNSTTFARNLGMGGTEIALNQPGFINYGNPAAYSTLWYTTYEGGLAFRQYEFQTNTQKHRSNTAAVSYFDFAFPITPQKWTLGFGLIPYSQVGYSVTDVASNYFGDEEKNIYEGSGGLNNFHIGSGYRFSKKLSFGVNAEYLFGVINNDRTVGYGSAYYVGTSIKSSTSIGWFHFKSGLQFRMDSLPIAKSDSIVALEKQIDTLETSLNKMIHARDSSAGSYQEKNRLAQEIAAAKLLKEGVVVKKKRSDWHLNLGLIFAPQADLHARNSLLVNSFRYLYYGTTEERVLARDTIVNTRGARSYVRLPLSTGFGFSLLKGNRWLFCSDFTYQQWSDFSFLGVTDSLENSWKVSGGIQFIPNDRSKAFFKLMQYRVGFHYEKGYLVFNGQSINDIGVSAGFSMPVRKAGTVLHFTFEAGERGTKAENLILERYFKFTLGFTINDRWFLKPKYD